MPLVDYQSTRRLLIEIDLNLAPFERWKEAGKTHAKLLRRFLSEVEASAASLIKTHLNQKLPSSLATLLGKKASPSLISKSLSGSGTLALTFVRCFGAEYQEEIQGLAAAANVCPGKLFLANLTYDISVLLSSSSKACSSLSLSMHGSPVLVRNMDWDMPRSTGRYTFITRFRKNGSSYLNIGPLGCVGVLSAMREGAWAVTLNQAPRNGLPNPTAWPSMHHLRAACDASLSFDSLVRKIRKQQTLTPFFAHVVGTQPEQQVLIEHISNKAYLRRPDPRGTLVQTNHFVSAKNASLNRGAEDDRGRTDCTSDFYCARYEALERRTDKKPRTLKEAFDTLARSPVTYESTMNAMLLRPSTGQSIVYVRD